MVRLLEPAALRGDLNTSLLLQELKTKGFVTVSTAAAVLQRSLTEARVALEELAGATLEGRQILVGVDGDPDPHDDPAYRLDPRDLLGRPRGGGGNARRLALLAEYAKVRGRVSSREAEDLTGSPVRLRSVTSIVWLKTEPSGMPGRGRQRTTDWLTLLVDIAGPF